MKTLSRSLKSVLVLGLSFQLAACGTILHPERRGQTGGRLDVGVVLLDGVGLFFFIIPGIIAYAVDFSDGTIYLPGGWKSGGRERAEMKIVKFDPKRCTPDSLRDLIRANTGYSLDWRDPRLSATRLRGRGELSEDFARLLRTPGSEGQVAGR